MLCARDIAAARFGLRIRISVKSDRCRKNDPAAAKI